MPAQVDNELPTPIGSQRVYYRKRAKKRAENGHAGHAIANWSTATRKALGCGVFRVDLARNKYCKPVAKRVDSACDLSDRSSPCLVG